jgi:hypothetical protein
MGMPDLDQNVLHEEGTDTLYRSGGLILLCRLAFRITLQESHLTSQAFTEYR